jgi:hypothetical protein
MNTTHIPHCAVCGGPFQQDGEPRYCEFCFDVSEDEISLLPPLPDWEAELLLGRRLS